MEIERKWMVKGWPENLQLLEIWKMDQGYISVRPTVRIRREELVGEKTEYILCFKGAPTPDGLAREEIETPIEETLYRRLEKFIGYPLIQKERRVYQTPDGRRLEVNIVDEGSRNEFCYAEVEFETETQARSWNPSEHGLGIYLAEECTGKPGSSMGAYWCTTRLSRPDFSF